MNSEKRTINWKDWLFLILTGLFCVGSIASGKPFVAPVSAEAMGYDLFSLLVWGLFFWNLLPFIRKIAARKQ